MLMEDKMRVSAAPFINEYNCVRIKSKYRKFRAVYMGQLAENFPNGFLRILYENDNIYIGFCTQIFRLKDFEENYNRLMKSVNRLVKKLKKSMEIVSKSEKTGHRSHKGSSRKVN